MIESFTTTNEQQNANIKDHSIWYKEDLLIALNNSNKQTKISYSQSEMIGEWAIWEIERKKIISHNWISLIAKKFKWPQSTNELSIAHYEIIWKKLKEANIPTYKTLRTNQDKSVIYMTDLEQWGNICISTNNDSKSKAIINSIVQTTWQLEVSNMKECISELEDIAQKAGIAWLSLSRTDIYFFIYNPKNKQLHPFIGDFDNINYSWSKYEWKQIKNSNLQTAWFVYKELSTAINQPLLKEESQVFNKSWFDEE